MSPIPLTPIRACDLTALVVEDESDIAFFIVSVLEGLGFKKVFEAEDGQTAENILRAENINFGSFDNNIPEVPGGVANSKKHVGARILRTDSLRPQSSLLFSALAGEQGVEVPEGVGILKKPVTMAEIEAKVIETFRKSGFELITGPAEEVEPVTRAEETSSMATKFAPKGSRVSSAARSSVDPVINWAEKIVIDISPQLERQHILDTALKTMGIAGGNIFHCQTIEEAKKVMVRFGGAVDAVITKARVPNIESVKRFLIENNENIGVKIVCTADHEIPGTKIPGVSNSHVIRDPFAHIADIQQVLMSGMEKAELAAGPAHNR